MRLRLFAAAVALLLQACSPAQLASNANQEGNRLWAGLIAYDGEQWMVRQEARRQCLERAINPGIDRLLAEGRFVDATKVWQENYPPVTFFDVFDDAKREGILKTMSKMPACSWPKDVKFDPAPAGARSAVAPMGPFMLTPVAPN